VSGGQKREHEDNDYTNRGSVETGGFRHRHVATSTTITL
jgi:hypothetical protein